MDASAFFDHIRPFDLIFPKIDEYIITYPNQFKLA